MPPVNVLQHQKAIIAAGHPQPPPKSRSNISAARAFGISIIPEITVEMLVVTDFIVRYSTSQQGEHGIPARARQGGIIAGGTHLDDAARRQLETARGFQRDLAIWPEFFDEALVGWLPVEFWPSGLDISGP